MLADKGGLREKGSMIVSDTRPLSVKKEEIKERRMKAVNWSLRQGHITEAQAAEKIREIYGS